MNSRILGIALTAAFVLGLGMCCGASVIMQENFESASSVLSSLMGNINPTGDFDIYSPGHTGNKCVRFNRALAGGYYMRSWSWLSSSTGRFYVSFWMNQTSTSDYNWDFIIDDPYNPTPNPPISTLPKCYVWLFEGYTWSTNNPWGQLRAVNPDGTYRNLCGMKTGWRQVKVVIDFNNKVYDVYYDDMNTPVGVQLPLMRNDVSASTQFVPLFTGYQGASAPVDYIDDIDIETLPTTTPVTIPPGPTYSMSSSAVSADISQSTGALVGLTGGSTRLVDSTNDIYTLQSLSSSAFSREAQDVVASTAGDSSSRTLTCTNSGLPGFTITKTYSFDSAGQLLKNVAFASSSSEGFITYISRVKLDSAFLQSFYWDGWPLMSGLSFGDQTFIESWGYATKTDYSAGIAVYRYAVNGNWVLPVVGDYMSCSSPNPDGWDVNVFTDYVSPSPVKSPAGQVRFVSLPGDFTALELDQGTNTNYQNLFNDPKPAWTKTLVCDAMYASVANVSGAMEAYCSPLAATSTIWFLAPYWGNWWSNSSPPVSSTQTYASLCAIAPGFRTNNPTGAKVSAYTNTTFDQLSDVYTQHPDYGIHDKDGSIIPSGLTSDRWNATAYYLQILNPTARQYWINMHNDRVKNWSLDFYYMDGPGTFAEVPDWTLKRVAQCYDWFSFYHDLKASIKTINANEVFFSNGNVPYSDMGYVEWRDDQWNDLAGRGSDQNAWRNLAKSLLAVKLREVPGYTWIPAYGDLPDNKGNPGSQPGIQTYSIAYGWCGHCNYAYDTVASVYTGPRFAPWMNAALEYRGIKLIPNAVQNPWYRSANPAFEAYGFTKGDNAVINVIPHTTATTATVTFDRASLGLQTGKAYLMRTLTMNDPSGGSYPATYPALNAPAFNHTTKLFYVNADTITLTVPVTKGLLTSVLISKAWVIVTSVGNIAQGGGVKACETGMPENYGVTAKWTSATSTGSRYSVTTSYAGAVVFFPYALTINSLSGVTTSTTTVDGVPGISATIASAGTYYFVVGGSAITPQTVAGVKSTTPLNSQAYVPNALVTDTNILSGSIFAESPDRSSGMRVVTSQSASVGQNVGFIGIYKRINGEYTVDSASIVSSAAAAAPGPLSMTMRSLANDPTESLSYVGVDVDGLLVSVYGRVNGAITGQNIICVDDGTGYVDGISGYAGVRVHLPAGATVPANGSYVVVTGIVRPEKQTLLVDTTIGGVLYPAGSVIYPPSVWVRTTSDMR